MVKLELSQGTAFVASNLLCEVENSKSISWKVENTHSGRQPELITLPLSLAHEIIATCWSLRLVSIIIRACTLSWWSIIMHVRMYTCTCNSLIDWSMAKADRPVVWRKKSHTQLLALRMYRWTMIFLVHIMHVVATLSPSPAKLFHFCFKTERNGLKLLS